MEDFKIHRIIRSKRKTVALLITPDAALTVHAPMRLPLDYIEDLVSKKSSWISRKISDVQSRPKAKPKEFVDAEEFLYLGKTCRLKITDDNAISQGEYLYFPKCMLLNAAENLKNWYKKQARQTIEERALLYARGMRLEYKSIAITNAKKRMGSCSIKGGLNFSWRLIMAPLEIVDYVVVHELIHLEEKNHSRSFWNKVKAILPDYKEKESFLKHNYRLFDL
jgi:predicted metal-dependent hydrolase